MNAKACGRGHGREGARDDARGGTPKVRWHVPLAVMLGLLEVLAGVACAQPNPLPVAVAADAPKDPGPSETERLIDQAHDAWLAHDKQALAQVRQALGGSPHPLLAWVEYWSLNLRWSEVSSNEVDAFLDRWPDAYVSDRARDEWLLELGHRGDWGSFLREQPRFRMDDDREVSCWGVLARQQLHLPMEGLGDGLEQARQAWWGQKEPDHGCQAMAKALLESGVMSEDDVWHKLRLAIEADHAATAQQAASLLGDELAHAVNSVLSDPQHWLWPSGLPPALLTGSLAQVGSTGSTGSSGGRAAPVMQMPSGTAKARGRSSKHHKRDRSGDAQALASLSLPRAQRAQLNLLAFIRWAAQDPETAAQAMRDDALRQRWHWTLAQQAWAWSQLAHWRAWHLSPLALDDAQHALADRALAGAQLDPSGVAQAKSLLNWSSETWSWMARAGLRAGVAGEPAGWSVLQQSVDNMPVSLQQDSAWLYWRAQAQLAQGPDNAQARRQAQALLARIAQATTFYGQLAAQALSHSPISPPPQPLPPTEDELSQAQALPGVQRALALLQHGWRSEGVREWNYTLTWGKTGGFDDRALLAIAEVACRREVWDRCINSSERTHQLIDLHQRYPTPYRDDVLAAAQSVGLEPAYLYGLMRQESRFIVGAQSAVGASGLMQVMPNTAAWTAKRLGLHYDPEQLSDRRVNLTLGAAYLKLLLDDFQGSQVLATAAYNAGPGRPRRWRQLPALEAAAWVENIPFNETRDYVKKVLSNAVIYAHVLQGQPLSLTARLGGAIGPRSEHAPPAQMDLP